MANQVQNPPTAAYWVSMIGGILGVLGGLVLIVLGAVIGLVSFGFGLAFIGGLGFWIMLCSIIVIVAASKLKANPLEHTKWGAIILVFSIIGGWSILDLIGGILALIYNPTPVGAAPQQYAPPQQPYYGPPTQPPAYKPQAHACPQCGNMVQPGVRFLPQLRQTTRLNQKVPCFLAPLFSYPKKRD
jgi:hypothetical protein